MTAILSATENDLYAFPLPIVVWSWHKIGIKSVVFCPSGKKLKIELAKKYCFGKAFFYEFNAEEKRIPTFSQVSRLFGAAINSIPDSEILVTGDSDLCVFNGVLNVISNDDSIQVVGYDLTPIDQYPMCFIKMTAKDWREVLNINKTYQEHISELINPIEGINIRGEQWNYDQWYIKKKLDKSGKNVGLVNRSNGITQFAQNRVDRDDTNWKRYLNENLIDAHLWRLGYTDENFSNILELMTTMYPNDNFDWLVNYRQKYLELI